MLRPGSHPRDRAAAGADGADFDHRHAHRQAVDLALVHDLDAIVAHQRYVVAGAAHVDADDIGQPSARDSASAAMAPPLGPESSSRTGSRAAVAGLQTLPFDCTRSSCGANFSAASRARNLSI